jgi:hypothetical protein
MGMTWGIKLQRFALVLAILAALAVASGAFWVEDFSWFGW